MATALPCATTAFPAEWPCPPNSFMSKYHRQRVRGRRVAIRHAQRQSLEISEALFSDPFAPVPKSTILRADAEAFVPQVE